MHKSYLFEHLDEAQKQEILSVSVWKTYEKGEYIFHQDAEPYALYVLGHGQICVCDDSADGEKNILTIISEAGDCFGEVYVLLNMKFPFYAQAMKKSEVLLIPREVVTTNVAISHYLNILLSQKAYTLSQKLKLMMKDTMREKILVYMEQHPVNIKRYEMASYLGVSRPALSKELYRMMDAGLIAMGEKGSLHITEEGRNSLYME